MTDDLTKHIYFERFQELRDHYKKLRSHKDGSHLIFLECFSNFCQYLKMPLSQIQLGIGVLTGCVPYLNETWKDVRCYDDDEIKLNINLKKNYEKDKSFLDTE